MIELPPTPPEDENHKPGYTTPPPNNANVLLTPQQTPRSKLRSSPLVARSYKQEQDVSMASHYDAPDVPRVSDDAVGILHMDRHVAYIPTEDHTEVHMQGDRSPESQHSTSQNAVSPLRIRKKRKQISPQHNRALSQSTTESGDWNDLPADMITNDLYKRIRQSKMERIEAIEEGSAIEAVVLMAETRTPSLRHVKKRHSLRIGSNSTVFSDTSREPDAVEGAALERRVTSLKHKKAFKPTRQDSEHIFAPAEVTLRTLRHERRPLSAGGRPQTSSSLQSVPLSTPEQPRHVSLPLRLKDKQQSRGTTREAPVEMAPDVVPLVQQLQSMPGFVLSEPMDIGPLPTITLNPIAGLSPSIKSHRFATQTPMSVISDRTEMELCEAKNVTLFPHSNESVLFINNGNVTAKPTLVPEASQLRPLSFTFENPEPSSSTSSDLSIGRSLSTPEIHVNGNHTVDSPLTNPRQAPLPPAIQFIPPTPSIEGDRQLKVQDDSAITTQPEVQRRGSIMRTAGRLSGTLLTPFMLRNNSVKHARPAPEQDTTNDRLHPMWSPTAVWDDDYSSDDEDYDYYDHDRLPAGGDTSAHPVSAPRIAFPRQMSVRMPGFRGTGGFLLGNSLGVERHGTNKRRHHVVLPSKHDAGEDASPAPAFLQSIRQHFKTRKAAREEAAREKRRAELKDSIGFKVVHHI